MATIDEFKSGMIVELKSGGPLMMVEEVISNVDLVTVIWFDRNHNLNRESIHPVSLVINFQSEFLT